MKIFLTLSMLSVACGTYNFASPYAMSQAGLFGSYGAVVPKSDYYGYAPSGYGAPHSLAGEYVKSSPVLTIREPAEKLYKSASYAAPATIPYTANSYAAAFKFTPSYKGSSYIAQPDSYAQAAAYKSAPYITQPASYARAAGYNAKVKIPASILNHGVEYAPHRKPYDPAVHLDEPARLISPGYAALESTIKSVGVVSQVDKNDPAKHGIIDDTSSYKS